jgi:acetyl esterase/lipase
MPSLVARGIRRLARRAMKTTLSEPDAVVHHFRRSIDRAPVVARMPKGVARRALDPGELPGVFGEWVGVPAASRAMLHHHGGAYVSGRPEGYRSLSARLARALRADVLSAAYRLAPEHRFPAALDDALTTYRAMIERFDPANLAVSGDSAGGGLTLALLQRVRDEGLPLPAAGVLLSPWADLTDDAPSRASNNEADDMLTRETLAGAASAYLNGADPRQPAASPVFGDLSGLPPLLVTVDESEVLLDDATRIVDGANAAGGQATLIRRSGLFHVWPVAVPILAEARETVGEMLAFLDKRLGAA